MALIVCPEEECGRKGISTTASYCPSCGADIQQFLKSGFTENALAFPIEPFEYWNDWHFWYYWGRSPDNPRPAKEGWIDYEEPLIKLRDIEVWSPVSGLVVKSNMRLPYPVDVGYTFECRKFVIVRLDKRSVHFEGKEMEPFEIGHTYRGLYAAIEAAEKSDGFTKKLIGKAFGVRSSFDLRNRFKSTEELLEEARKLENIHAIWLSRDSYEKGLS